MKYYNNSKCFVECVILGLEWLALFTCLVVGIVTFYAFLLVFPLSIAVYYAGKRQSYWQTWRDYVCLKWGIRED